MEGVTKKSDFKSAYDAGRRAVEGHGQSFNWMYAVALGVVLILTRVTDKWLAARYSLSGLERTLLDIVAGVLVVSIFLVFRRGVHHSGEEPST
jgi:hypothetical protein